jgi:hypothetical protein
LLVGIIGLGLIPWIVWTLRRGLRDGRLPIGRAYVRRDERRGAYNVLLGFYLIAMLIAGFIGLDLIFDLEKAL